MFFFRAHAMGEVVEHDIFHIRQLFFGSVGGQEAAFRSCKVFHCFYFYLFYIFCDPRETDKGRPK